MHLFKHTLQWTLALLIAGSIAGCGGGSGGSSTAPPQAPPPPLPLGPAIDAQAAAMMSKSGATAISVAVVKNGLVLYEKSYGFQDAAKTIPLKTDALLRTASIVKPVTAAAIQKLANAGKLSLSDHVFCTGINAPCWLPSTVLPATPDNRTRDITILHLINHTGGWDGHNRGIAENGDPVGIEPMIRDKLSLSGPPTRNDIIGYVMAFPLDFTPGATYAYSNFGYMLLGMIIEQASQTSYTEYVQATIMAPMGVTAADFKAGHSLPADHDPREPPYISSWLDAPSVFTKGKLAPFAEEGLLASNWTAVGFSIATARTMALFASAYKIPGGTALPTGTFNDAFHTGGIDGTATFLKQLPSGVSYAVLMNVAINSEDYLPYFSQLDSASQRSP